MIKRGLLDDWSLAGFTLAIQIACGISMATSVATATHPQAQSEGLRILGIALFPIVAAGVLLSLMHLGRPLSAWRALTNVFRSRLSREVALTLLFALSSLLYSLSWWSGPSDWRVYAGVTTSICGIAAVISSALVYIVPTKQVWDSGWVMASFTGNTLLAAGLAELLAGTRSHLGTISIVLGSVLVLFSVARLWFRLAQSAARGPLFLLGLLASALLIVPLPLVVLLVGARSLSFTSMVLGTGVVVLGMIAGRMLMSALAEDEPQF